MVSPKYVLLLPVRTVLYVLWLPYALLLLVLAFVHKCIKRVVSIPVYYLGTARARGRLVWSWTKSRARLSLPWWSRPCTATSTQTADLEVVGVAALPAAGYTPPVELPLALAASYEAASTVRRRRGRSSRQALHYLIDLLLQPNSPNGSDDEGEGPQQPPPRLALPSGREEEEAEKALKLILDLVKLSKTRGGMPLATTPQESMLQSRQKASEIAALVCHARDRERLQSLIQELDQLATEVDPAALLESERRAKRKSRSRSAELLLSSEQDPFAELGSRAATTAEEGEGVEDGGSETGSEEQGSVSRGSTSESERASSAEDDQSSPLSPLSPVKLDEPIENRLVPDVDVRHGYRSVLSPVHESPELNRSSTSPEFVSQLENDLDTTLSQIDSEANDIRVNLEALESIERKVAQASGLYPASGSLVTRPTTSAAEPPSSRSEVDDKPVFADTGGNVIWKSSIVVHRNRSDSGLSSIEDPQEEFPGIPHTDPSLGLREGHARRDLAIARSSSKRKLPTRKTAQEPLSEHKPDELRESAALEQQLLEQDTEALEEEAPRFNPRRLAGAIQVLPPITDQIKLLKPGTFPLQEALGDQPTSASPSPSPCPSPLPVEDEAPPLLGTKPPLVSFESQTQTKRWYETDPEMPPETVSAPPETEEEKAAFGISTSPRRRSSSDAGSEVWIPKPWESAPPPPPPRQLPQPPSQQPKKSLMITSNQPPWIEMVAKERKQKQVTPPPQPGTTPPKRSFLAATPYDVSPTKDPPTIPITSPPLLDPPEYYEEEESIYDTLQPKPLFEGMALPPMRYLHQLVTPSQEQDVTASPILPPRNSTRSSRSISEEKDRKSRRRERSASSSTERTPSHESKSSSRHSRSEERGHRSSESSKKHRSSSSESSSSRHGSHSERASSHSTEKKQSSHSSDKHSSSSKSKESESKKKHSSSSSPSSSRKHSTSSSRAKESTASKKESSTKRSSSRDKEESKSKAEGSKSSSKSKGESSRSSKSKAEKTPEKSSRSKTGSTSSPSSSSSSPSSKSSSSKASPSSKSTSSKSSPPPISGATAKELKKSTSLNSLSSVRSHGAASTYSLRLDGKETEI